MKVEWVRLGDVLELQRRAVAVDPETMYCEVGVRSFGRGLFLKDPVSGADLGNKRVFHVEPDDLVVSNVFAWEGAVGVADERHSGTIGSHRFMTWRPSDASKVDVRFIAYYLGSDPGLATLQAASPGSAGRNRTLSIKNLKAIEAPLPPLTDQRRIAAHLDSVGDVGHGAADGSVVRSSSTQGLLEHAVTRAAAEAERVPLSQLIARDREWVTVDPGGIYKPVGVRGFGRGLIRYPETKGSELSKLRYYALRSDRLLVSNIKAWEGAVASTTERDDGRVASNRFLQYEVDTSVRLEWLRLWLTSRVGTAELALASPGSADRNRTLSMDTFERIEVPVPVLPVQTRVIALAGRIHQVRERASRSTQLIEALLPAARNEIFSAMR